MPPRAPQHKRVKCSGTRRRVELYIYRCFRLACYFHLYVRRNPLYIFSENSVSQQFLSYTAENLNIYHYRCEQFQVTGDQFVWVCIMTCKRALLVDFTLSYTVKKGKHFNNFRNPKADMIRNVFTQGTKKTT